MTEKRRPSRPVHVLTPAQEALLSAITDSERFTLEAVLARHAAVECIAERTGVSRKVVDTFAAISAPGNAHLFTKEAAHKAFEHLKPADPDLQSQHLTPADGNVFADLGFTPQEAARLLAEADRKITLLAMKEASIARTLADASAALKAGTLKRLTTSTQSRRLRVRAPLEVLEKAAPKARGKVISSIIDTMPNAPRGEALQLERASQAAPAAPATELQMQLAHDFAILLLNERGQKTVVQHLYDEIGQSSVAALLGAKR